MAKTMFDNIKLSVDNTMSTDIKMIDINELHSSEDNYFEMNRIDELAETILGQGGVKENLIVSPLPTGGYEIISGHRRTAAVRLLLDNGEKVSRFLPCLVQKYASPDDKRLNLIFMNVTARRLSDAELWTSYEKVDAILKKKKEAGEKFGKLRDTLAGYLGVSSSQIGKLQNIEKYATDKVKEAVSNGSISISTANQIARLDEKEQEAIVDTQDVSKIKTKDVKDQIDNSKKVDTSVKFPTISNSEKVDTNVKFSNNTGDKKTISISDPFIVDLVEKLIERMYVRDVYNYETCGKPEWMCPEKNSAEHMVGLSIFSYAKEHFPDLFPDDE